MLNDNWLTYPACCCLPLGMTSNNEHNLSNYDLTGYDRNVMGQNFTWYQLMDKMIGEKRQRFSDANVSPMGIPQAPKQREEIIIQRVFDSCAFKAIMSFTMGLYVIGRKNIHNQRY